MTGKRPNLERAARRAEEVLRDLHRECESCHKRYRAEVQVTWQISCTRKLERRLCQECGDQWFDRMVNGLLEGKIWGQVTYDPEPYWR